MQQLLYLSAQKAEWQEVPSPVLTTAKSALVKPMAVARCDLDRFVVAGQYRTPEPFALGHEIAGVVDVSDQVISIKSGDRVIVPFRISCGECKNGKRGWTNAWFNVPFCSSYGLGTNRIKDFGGGFSDLIELPFADSMLVKMPKKLSYAAASGLSDSVAYGYRTVAPHLKL
jgi:alcohol dehydrogenase